MKSRHPAVELPDYKSLNCNQKGAGRPVTASLLFHCSSGHFVPLQNTTARWWRRAASKQEDCMENFKDTSRLQFPPSVTSKIIHCLNFMFPLDIGFNDWRVNRKRAPDCPALHFEKECKSICLFKCGAYTEDNAVTCLHSFLYPWFFKKYFHSFCC